MAEKRNLIFSLGNIILEKVSAFLSFLRESNYSDLRVSVNLSGLQLLRDGFVEVTKQKLNLSATDWRRLIFEITESILLENFEVINQTLSKLRDMGSSVALDDFGTGYSSLAELRNLNLDMIKIDRSFIDRIARYGGDALVTNHIIAMAHKLGLKVVAEGVENKYQLDYLKKHSCDIVQGFYLSKPLSKYDVLRFLKSKSR